MRIFAAVVAALAVLTTMLVTLRLAGRIAASIAGLLMATAGASPYIESFTLAGELLASVPAILSLLAFVAYVRDRRPGWLAVAGLLTGCAFMIKQSAIDGGLAAAAFLLWTGGRRNLRPVALLASFAAIPVAVGAATAPQLGTWWYAVVGYRGTGDSLLTGSPLYRFHLLHESLPVAAKALAVLVVLAALGWRRAPLLARFWLVAAIVGVVGGGNFHSHYYLQLVPPLSLLAGIGGARLLRMPRRLPAIAFAGAAAATLVVTAPLWFESGRAQAKAVWPQDPHLVNGRAVATYVRRHTFWNDRVLVLWAAANQYYLADRRPAVSYMWYRNIESIPGALPAVQRALADRRPALVVVVQPPGSLDPSGQTERVLRRNYVFAARVAGVPIYRPIPWQGTACRCRRV